MIFTVIKFSLFFAISFILNSISSPNMLGEFKSSMPILSLLIVAGIVIMINYHKKTFIPLVHPTIMNRHTKGFQFHISRISDEELKVENKIGLSEIIAVKQLPKDLDLLNYFLSIIEKRGEYDVVYDEHNHILKISNLIEANEFFMIPTGECSTKVSDHSSNLFDELVETCKNSNEADLKDKFQGIQELKELLYVYIEKRFPLKLILTKDYVFIKIKNKYKIFKVDVGGFINSYKSISPKQGKVLAILEIENQELQITYVFSQNVNSYPFRSIRVPLLHHFFLERSNHDAGFEIMNDLKNFRYKDYVQKNDLDFFGNRLSEFFYSHAFHKIMLEIRNLVNNDYMSITSNKETKNS